MNINVKKVSSYPAYVLHVHTLAFSLGQTRHVPLLRCLGGVGRILLRGGFQLNFSDIRDQFRIVHRDAVQHVISGHIGVERLPPAMKRSILCTHTPIDHRFFIKSNVYNGELYLVEIEDRMIVDGYSSTSLNLCVSVSIYRE